MLYVLHNITRMYKYIYTSTSGLGVKYPDVTHPSEGGSEKYRSLYIIPLIVVAAVRLGISQSPIPADYIYIYYKLSKLVKNDDYFEYHVRILNILEFD